MRVLAKLLVAASAIVFAVFLLFPPYRWEAEGHRYGETRTFVRSPLESLQRGTELVPARLRTRDWLVQSATSLTVTVLLALVLRKWGRNEA